MKNSLTTNKTSFDRKQTNCRETLLSLVVWIRWSGIPVVYRLNLALFYLFGTYYRISKRLIGLQYVSFRAQSNYQALFYFRLFGALNIAQIVLSAVFWIRDILRSHRPKEATVAFQRLSESGVSEEVNDLFGCSSFQCSLCWQYNKPPVCIPCGHLFCWNCISKHIQFTVTSGTSAFCPQCRKEFHQSRVVPLLNM